MIGTRFNDILSGTDGANTIEGGGGSDAFTGFGGSDKFVTNGGDATIRDFELEGDEVDSIVTGDERLDQAFAGGLMEISGLFGLPEYNAVQPMADLFPTMVEVTSPNFKLLFSDLDEDVLFAFGF